MDNQVTSMCDSQSLPKYQTGLSKRLKNDILQIQDYRFNEGYIRIRYGSDIKLRWFSSTQSDKSVTVNKYLSCSNCHLVFSVVLSP